MNAAARTHTLSEGERPVSLPGPTYRTPISFLLASRPDPLAYTYGLVRRYGPELRVRVWGLPAMHVFTRPDDVRHVMQENNRNYVKGDIIAKMKVLLGEGLFTSEGDFWRRQRRLAQPAFHRQRIQGFGALMTDTVSRALIGWEEPARDGRPIDVMEEMSRLTLTIVGRALFGIDLADRASDVGRPLLIALEELTRYVLNPIALPLALPTPGHRRLRRALLDLDRVVLAIIEKRRREPGEHDDLLAMLMEARDADTGESMSSRQLRDEVMTFVLAGHETTAVTLAWAVHLLESHPEVEAAVRREVRSALGDRRPELADLRNLALVRRVIDETLRLYPPLSALHRQAIAADEIGGVPIPPRGLVFLLPYITHRDPTVWPDPERFDPDRFLPEAVERRHRFAYFPFGAGPRLCIGNEFALMEAQIALAMMLQRWRFEPVPGRPVSSEVRITLRPTDGVWMRLRPA